MLGSEGLVTDLVKYSTVLAGTKERNNGLWGTGGGGSWGGQRIRKEVYY